MQLSAMIETEPVKLVERKVPEGQLSRVWNFTKLGVSILGGTVQNTFLGKMVMKLIKGHPREPFLSIKFIPFE